jgi:hypothetical protein
MIVTMEGKYKTKLGVKVRRVLCVDRYHDLYPVLVELENGEVGSYTSDGNHLKSDSYNDRNLIEVSEWDEFKLDDKVMVSDGGIQWERRYFAGVNVDGLPTVYQHWATSWSGKGYPVVIWQLCRKPTEEELK